MNDIWPHTQKDWPQLTKGNHCVTSGRDPAYNCIAWALAADKTRNWWPAPGAPEYYWPEGIRRDSTIDAFHEGMIHLGFEPCNDFEHEVGYVKVVVYATTQRGSFEPQHAARQRTDGQWTSKMGQREDITHSGPDAVGGGMYGRPVRYYRRLLQPSEFDDMDCS
jgi:hypothetical protein